MKVDARTINDVTVSPNAKYASLSREGASNRVNGVVIPDVDRPHLSTVATASFERRQRATASLRSTLSVGNALLSPDSRYAFASIEGVGVAPGKVDVYDPRALAKVGTVDVGLQAGGTAFWKTERARP